MTRIQHDPAIDPAPGIDPVKAVFTFCAAIFFVLSPALTGGFSGYDTALFPYPFENHPAQPAGYAFSIWGLIYLWLLVSTGAGLFTRRSTDPAWDATRLPLIFSLGPGAAWIGVAKFSPVMATVLIFWMLGTALLALFRAPTKDRWLLQAPLAIYAGWLTAASFVSLAVVGTGYGIGPGATAWAIVALLGALLVGTGVLLRLRRAPEYGAALVWALLGIVVANAGDGLAVALLAAVGMVLVGSLAWRTR